MKTLTQIKNEIKGICKLYPVMEERIFALNQAGYGNIHYLYVKGSTGLLAINHLKRKQIYRIQIGYTELQKGYPVAWCIDFTSIDVVDEVELPF